jgi:UDP-glucose 4-epimerase
MKCLVTGVAGFIGSNLAEQLLEQGYELVGIDCFTDYYSQDLKEKNLSFFKNHPKFTFLKEDIVKIDLFELLEDIDYVFHQAAQAGVRASWGQFFNTYTNNNIKATQQLLEAAKEFDIKKFVYASSSSVYGDTDQLPMKETNKLQPVSPYGVSKLAAENLCYLYWKNFGVPTISLRYFTVFGERQRPDMAFHIFIKEILTDGKITIFGDGKQSRNFTYVGDVVQANILAAESDIQGEIFNVGGGGERVELNTTIELMEDIIGKTVDKEYQTVVKGDMKHTEADETKIRQMLDYQPQVSLRAGLEREVAWLEKIY